MHDDAPTHGLTETMRWHQDGSPMGVFPAVLRSLVRTMALDPLPAGGTGKTAKLHGDGALDAVK